MGKSTISMAIFHSYISHYRRVYHHFPVVLPRFSHVSEVFLWVFLSFSYDFPIVMTKIAMEAVPWPWPWRYNRIQKLSFRLVAPRSGTMRWFGPEPNRKGCTKRWAPRGGDQHFHGMSGQVEWKSECEMEYEWNIIQYWYQFPYPPNSFNGIYSIVIGAMDNVGGCSGRLLEVRHLESHPAAKCVLNSAAPREQASHPVSKNLGTIMPT